MTNNQDHNKEIRQPGSKSVLALNSFVLVNMFDGTIKGSPGVIIGNGRTKKGDNIYLVQMMDTKLAARGKQDGCAQIEHGKEWVLSLYSEELTPTTQEAAESALQQSQARPGEQSKQAARAGR